MIGNLLVKHRGGKRGEAGAEGFEVSFPSDRYAVFFVRFNCKTTQFEGFAGILRGTLPSRIFSPMDSFSQDFRITKAVKVGAEGIFLQPRKNKSDILCSQPVTGKRSLS